MYICQLRPGKNYNTSLPSGLQKDLESSETSSEFSDASQGFDIEDVERALLESQIIPLKAKPIIKIFEKYFDYSSVSEIVVRTQKLWQMAIADPKHLQAVARVFPIRTPATPRTN